MGPHGLSFNIEQTPTGGVNVTVQQAGGVRGEVRVNGVSSEIPATNPRARTGNRGGAATASRSSASPGTQPDLRQRHLCTVRGCKYVARTKGFVDRKKLVLHVLEKHPGTELASSFRTEGFTKVKGQHKLKKLKKKPEPGAAVRKKTKTADTTKKTNKQTRKKSTSAAATPTMRRTPPPRREEEPVVYNPLMFAQSPRAAAKGRASGFDSDSDSDSDSDTSSSGGSSSSGDDGLGSDSDEDIARTDDEGENGDDGRPGVLDDGDAWETVKTEPDDDAIEISTDEEPMDPEEPMEPMETEPRVVKPKPQSPQSPKRTPRTKAPSPPPLEPVHSIDVHPFVADAPQIHATYAADDEGAFTSLALRCIRARRDEGLKQGSRKGGSRRGKGSSDETAPATRFANADDYVAYHRLLVLEDCASGAHDEFKLNTGAGRTTTRWKVQSGFTSVAALTAAASIEGLATVVLTRDRKAEKNGNTGNFPTTDDVVELRFGNGKEDVVLGIVADAHPDGASASASVCADDLLGASALTRGAAVSVKVGYSLTTTRREFHAVQTTVTRLHAPLVAPLLLGQPLYAGWNNDSHSVNGKEDIPGTKQKANPLPLTMGMAPRNIRDVERVIDTWRDAGEFNANQADAIRRCVSPGALGPDTPETVRPCMGVALLHGPPGTGKTNTLVGVVSALLLCSPKPRILLCAPSNAAIDELALRVFNGRLNANGMKIGMKSGELVRVGPIDQVSHRMRPHALNTLVDAQMESVVGRRTMKEEDLRRKAVIIRAQVVAATTSAAGGAYLTQSGVGFDCVIIDEAAQASEAATLVPLAHSGGNKGETLGAKRLVLVGDHMQLPAMAHAADQNLKMAYAASLFERLETSHPAVALTAQHRMHADIARWPARYFYRGELTNAADAPTESPFVESLGSNGDGCVCVDGLMVRLKSYAFLDFHGEEGVGASSKSSIMNESEAKVVATVVKAARRWARSGASVAVITPYREQRDLIVKHVDDVSVRVGTVDGFQGQEADIVIISCTRTKQLGFLEDERRLNVALTRARECLLIVGSADFMRQKSGPWKELVDDAAERDCLHPVVSAGPGHVDGRKVSTLDYDARVLETKVETQERTLNVIKRDPGRDRNVRERLPEPSGPRRVVVVRKRAHTPERQAGRQPQQQPGQQQRRRVVVNTSPAQKRRELEDKARRELQDKLVVKAKLDEQRRRRLERERRDRRGYEQRGGDDLRGRLGKSGPPPSYDERNNRRPDDDDRWEWR